MTMDHYMVELWNYEEIIGERYEACLKTNAYG